MSVNRQFCHRLPKIELHAHLSGSISRECLHDIWATRKAAQPTFGLQDPLIAMPAGKTDYDIETFFPLFSTYIYALISTPDALLHSTTSVLSDFEADGVSYLELRTTPRELPSHGITREGYVDLVLQCIHTYECNPAHSLRTKLILSIDRRNSPEVAMEVADLAIKLHDNGVVGLDLCGDPASTTGLAALAPAFAKARDAGVPLTLHFAEAPPSASESELAMLLSWRPSRLGHVIHVPSRVRQEIVRAGVAVELCLSCNVRAKMLPGGAGDGYAEHHFGVWWGEGARVAICTDDVGVFCSSLSEEYQLASQHFGLSREDVKKLCFGVVDATFASDEEKSRLRRQLEDWQGWNA